MKRFRLALITGLLAGHMAGGALAGEVADAAAKAESLASEGKYDEALSALDTARDAVWNQAPLSFAKSLFVASDPAGFGIYDRRDSNEFKPGETIVIYTEPRGYGYGSDGEMKVISLKLDFEIKDKAGTSLAKQEGFAAWNLRSRVANKEFMGKITYDFSGLEPGEYEVTTTVKDQNSDKTGSFSMPFKIVP